MKHLDNGVVYLRISSFLPTVLERVLSAIDDLHDAPAPIIDLRGNPGGVFPVLESIASKLVGEQKLFMRYQQRDGLREAYLVWWLPRSSVDSFWELSIGVTLADSL